MNAFEKIRNIVLDHLYVEFAAFVGGVLVLFLRKLFNNNKGDKMEKAIELGKEGKVDIKLANGKLYLIGGYDGVDLDAKLEVGIEVDVLFDKLKAKIPGQIDDAIIEVLKAALKVV